MRCKSCVIQSLLKGDSKSNALKHKMINHMKDFQMVEDSENPEIVISVGEMERYYKLSINIVICYPKLLLSGYTPVI